MIDHKLSFTLPEPWLNKTFETSQIGGINFLVGPNGSGKTRFATSLWQQLGGNQGKARLLGTDRLSDMSGPGSLRNYLGDNFRLGFAKDQFDALRAAGREGSGIDTVILLEERVDLRIQIEATLSHLFNREISLEWDSGYLLPKATLSGSGQSYRLDREECHGIKELLVLLTHLYDDNKQHLIVDEPELNLHPQYQAFFMQEVRRVAGDPAKDPQKKAVFLVTHSPFILDLKTEDDLKSIISFDLQYSMPKQVLRLGLGNSLLDPFTSRLNAHHKQLFFSDNPIFVEGIHDARVVEALMEARGASIAGAGSCIIDAGGVDEVNQYLDLCQSLGKTAYFLYDLDSLFKGRLRACIKEDETVQGFLLSSGLGHDFAKYCGELERELKPMIKELITKELPETLSTLSKFLNALGNTDDWQKEQWQKARTALMTAISTHKDDVVSVLSSDKVKDIEGRRDQILNALKEKSIFVLPGGTLERYLPSYSGNEYDLRPEAKAKAVHAEIGQMVCCTDEDSLAERYGELFEVICNLPSKTEVDVESVLKNHLSDYIHDFQKTVVNNPEWEIDHIRERLNTLQQSHAGVFHIRDFNRSTNGDFDGTIGIPRMLGQPEKLVRVSNHTNAGIGDFEIEPVLPVSVTSP